MSLHPPGSRAPLPSITSHVILTSVLNPLTDSLQHCEVHAAALYALARLWGCALCSADLEGLETELDT